MNPNPNECERFLKRWREIIDHVRGQLSDLLWQREQIRRIGKMIVANPRLLAGPSRFCGTHGVGICSSPPCGFGAKPTRTKTYIRFGES